MKINKLDQQRLGELGLLIPIPAEIPRAWIVPIGQRKEKNFDKAKIDFILGEQSAWQKANFELKRYNGYDWPQKVAINTLFEDLVAVALSLDLVAGEDSDGFLGYYILTKQEYEDIKTQLFKLIKDKTNGLHHYLLEIVKQGYSGDKIYWNYFSGVKTIDCQDDGLIKFITPKRKLPKSIRCALGKRLEFRNWDESEYRCDAFTGDEYAGIQEIIILQNEYEANERETERLAEVNSIITTAMKE